MRALHLTNISKEERLNSSPTLQLEADTNGKIINRQRLLTDFFGLDRETLIGLPLSKFIPETDHQHFLEDLKCASRHPLETIHSRLTLQSQNGQFINVVTTLNFRKNDATVKITATEIITVTGNPGPSPIFTDSLSEIAFETDPCPGLISDSHGAVIRYNNSFRNAFGLNGSQLEKEQLSDLFDSVLDISYPNVLKTTHSDKYLFYLKNDKVFETEKRTINVSGELCRIWSFREIKRNRSQDPAERQNDQADDVKYRAVVEQSQDCIFLVDLHAYRVIEANDSLARLLGYSSEELMELTLYDFVNHGKEEIDKRVTRIKNQQGFLGERQYRTKTGEIVPVEVRGHMINFNHQELMCVVARDITERKKAEKILNNYKKDLEDQVAERTRELHISNQELAQFAYIASHDLKTPLRAISSLVSWLAHDYNDKFDEKGKGQLKLLIDRTRRMHNFIDGINLYSKAGEKNNKPERVDLKKIISQIITQYSVIYPTSHIVVDNDLEDILYHHVKAEQVFINLIENALSHNDKPKPKVNIGFRSANESIVYYVRDNGPGIPYQHQEKIFKMFQRLDTRDEKEATGIGLTIAKKIIESNGGRIWLESSPGKGATFYFNLNQASG